MADVADPESLIVRLHEWFASVVEEPKLMLGDPAAVEELASLEEHVGAQLPADFRSNYLAANGQSSSCEHPAFADAFSWLTLQGIASNWDVMNDLYEGPDDEEFGDEWWRPGLLPFASDGSGDMLCVDVSGRAGGSVGAIVHFVHDDWPFQRAIHPGPFGAWFNQYVDDLHAGKYDLEDGRFVASR